MMTPPMSGMSQLSIEQKAPSRTEQKTPPNNTQPPQTAQTSQPVAAPFLNGGMKQGTMDVVYFLELIILLYKFVLMPLFFNMLYLTVLQEACVMVC